VCAVGVMVVTSRHMLTAFLLICIPNQPPAFLGKRQAVTLSYTVAADLALGTGTCYAKCAWYILGCLICSKENHQLSQHTHSVCTCMYCSMCCELISTHEINLAGPVSATTASAQCPYVPDSL
jgi:hypothetical protein